MLVGHSGLAGYRGVAVVNGVVALDVHESADVVSGIPAGEPLLS